MPEIIKKPKNPFRISLRTLAENEGFESMDELIEEYGNESVMPALCVEGCQVEPDGRCSHGCPSILLALGVI